MATTLNTDLFDCNNPEAAHMLGRLEAQAELVDVLRTAVAGIDLAIGEGDLALAIHVHASLRGLIESHDRMVAEINSHASANRNIPRAPRPMRRASESGLGPIDMIDGDFDLPPAFDPDAHQEL